MTFYLRLISVSFRNANYDGGDSDMHLGIRMGENGLASVQRFDLRSISVFWLPLLGMEISLNSEFYWLVMAFLSTSNVFGSANYDGGDGDTHLRIRISGDSFVYGIYRNYFNLLFIFRC